MLTLAWGRILGDLKRRKKKIRFRTTETETIFLHLQVKWCTVAWHSAVWMDGRGDWEIFRYYKRWLDDIRLETAKTCRCTSRLVEDLYINITPKIMENSQIEACNREKKQSDESECSCFNQNLKHWPSTSWNDSTREKKTLIFFFGHKTSLIGNIFHFCICVFTVSQKILLKFCANF